MELRLCILVLVISICFAANINPNGLNPTTSPWNRLILDLLDESRYQPYVRPYTTNGKALNVSHSLQLLRVDSLVDQVVTLNTWIQMQWKDERLSWNPDYYDSVWEVYIPSQLIWVPDIVLYNSVDEWKISPGNSFNAIATHDGNVTISFPTKIRSMCNYKIKDMKRHNNVTCTFKFGSWTYVRNYMDIYNYGRNVITTDTFYPSEILKVTNTSATREVIKYTCCPEEYVSLIYSISFKYTGN